MPKPILPPPPQDPPPPGPPTPADKPFKPSDKPARKTIDDDEADALLRRLRRGEYIGKEAE